MAIGCRIAVVAFVATACGDNVQPTTEDVIAQLRALPHVHDAAEQTTLTPGVHYIVLHFAQPVDHADPMSPTFLQEVSLLHRDIDAPLVVHTSGYWDYYRDQPVELTQLLTANQISIEHRYFGESRPEPADWTQLTVEQMANDEHVIVSELRTIYPGMALATGGSKGGMTAVFYRRFFPDDVDGTVPYVAPISFGAPDLRYAGFFDSVGTADCRQAVREIATHMLRDRRAALEQRTREQATQNSYSYSRVAVEPAVEAAIASVEWSFWQYFGIEYCPQLPGADATDDQLFEFLDAVSAPSDNDDAKVRLFEAFYYQADFQLGYPNGGGEYLRSYLKYSDSDYIAALPTLQPPYDGGAAMRDIDDFVRNDGDRFVFVYGEWDPWTAGAFELGDAADSLRLVVRRGTHAATLSGLAEPDREAAFAKLAAWTHVQPTLPVGRALTAAPKPVRPPSAWMRALRVVRRAR